MSAPLNHPVIIDAEPTVKMRLSDLLNDLDFGREPSHDASDGQRAQAEADRKVIRAAIADVDSAATDQDADRVFMVAMAALAARGCRRGKPGSAGSGRRHSVTAGRIAPGIRPLPVFDATAQALGMQGSPLPARIPAPRRLTPGEWERMSANTIGLQAEIAVDDSRTRTAAARDRVAQGTARDGGAR